MKRITTDQNWLEVAGICHIDYDSHSMRVVPDGWLTPEEARHLADAILRVASEMEAQVDA